MPSGVFQRTLDGATYAMIPEDLDIMARALYGEEGSHPSELAASATLWTWMNRFMLHPKRDKHWRYFYELIQDHSQPVNPLWRRNGKKCLSAKYKNTDHCSESRLKRRDMIADWSYDEIPAGCRQWAEAMYAGLLPQLLDNTLVDFATNKVAKTYGTQYIPGGQWYLNKTQTIEAGLMKTWLPGNVVIESTGSVGGGQGLGIALATGAWILLTGWAITRLI